MGMRHRLWTKICDCPAPEVGSIWPGEGQRETVSAGQLRFRMHEQLVLLGTGIVCACVPAFLEGCLRRG